MPTAKVIWFKRNRIVNLELIQIEFEILILSKKTTTTTKNI